MNRNRATTFHSATGREIQFKGHAMDRFEDRVEGSLSEVSAWATRVVDFSVNNKTYLSDAPSELYSDTSRSKTGVFYQKASYNGQVVWFVFEVMSARRVEVITIIPPLATLASRKAQRPIMHAGGAGRIRRAS